MYTEVKFNIPAHPGVIPDGLASNLFGRNTYVVCQERSYKTISPQDIERIKISSARGHSITVRCHSCGYTTKLDPTQFNCEDFS